MSEAARVRASHLERTAVFHSHGYDRQGSARFIIDEAGSRSGLVLDVGTGKGVQAVALAHRGLDVVTVDPDPQEQRFAKLNALGDEASDYIQRLLPSAVERFRNVFLLTHVPPFRDACWHEGEISDDEFLPHFTCQAVGDVLFSFMQRHPQCSATILCGHTHGHGEATILPNLHVKTGGAEYGQPKVQEVIVAE